MARKQRSRKQPGEDNVEAGDERRSGDAQGLRTTPEADSESVAELIEEGQSFEAGVVAGVENAPDPDVAEVKTHQVPEDDVPTEYIDSKDQQ